MADSADSVPASDNTSPKRPATDLGSTGSLFSRTLQDITTTKLEELTKKRKQFEQLRIALLAKTEDLSDPLVNLEAWSSGVKQCFGIRSHDGRIVRGSTRNLRLEIDLQNIDRFLGQARYDPSISAHVRAQWQTALQRHVDIQSLKYSYATLYGQLTTEWLAFRQPRAAAGVSEDIEMDGFEHVAGSKKLESRLKWEQTVFEPAQVDRVAIDKMLRDAFEPDDDDEKHLQQAIQHIRTQVKSFERSLSMATNFTHETLGWTINSLLSSDLLTDEKREVLRDFQANTVILTEIADVLNMWISSIETWSWGDEVGLEERRRVDGTFSVYMHEDLLHAIFLHYIGIKWSVLFKRVFKVHLDSTGVWKTARKPLPRKDQNRREYYLGYQNYAAHSVESKRQHLYRDRYFLASLADTEHQQLARAEGEEEADFDEFVAGPGESKKRMMMQMQMPVQMMQQQPLKRQKKMAQRPQMGRTKQTARTSLAAHGRTSANMGYDDDDEDDDQANTRNPMDAKQALLHLLSTEILIKTRLHGEITCFRSQFDSWFPNLPHDTILQVMSFFGVARRWIDFFRHFLQPPLRFLDDTSAQPRKRQRGVPSSHVLSEMFGEAVLFALDFQVNQVTDGEKLWRMHDDFWFWSAKEGTCEAAWATITAFTKTMGATLNHARTGCARMRRNDKNADEPFTALRTSRNLPEGPIRWGMLVLEPSAGRFAIDEQMVQKHIRELSRQLKDKAGSVFAWIQAWNTYAATFFTSNFGRPANCFGRAHVDHMLATHERIQRAIFASLTGDDESETASSSDGSGSVVEYLKQTIARRFGIDDIPDGYFFFPIELGGLDVQSPFISLLQIRDTVTSSPEKRLDDFEKAELAAYKAAKAKFDRGDQNNQCSDPRFRPEKHEAFLGFDEYIQYREQVHYGFSNELVDVFDSLLGRPSEVPVDSEVNGPVMTALNTLGNAAAGDRPANLRGILADWNAMDPYWKWVVQLYGGEMMERFGGLSIVDPGQLPIGMVGLFQSGRVKWQE